MSSDEAFTSVAIGWFAIGYCAVIIAWLTSNPAVRGPIHGEYTWVLVLAGPLAAVAVGHIIIAGWIMRRGLNDSQVRHNWERKL